MSCKARLAIRHASFKPQGLCALPDVWLPRVTVQMVAPITIQVCGIAELNPNILDFAYRSLGSLFAQVYFCSNNSGNHWPVPHLLHTGHLTLWASKGPIFLPLQRTLLCLCLVPTSHHSRAAVGAVVSFSFKQYCRKCHFIMHERIVCFYLDISTRGVSSKSALLSLSCTSLLCCTVAAIALIF